jgi:predicted acylesterase/phospholipase RssA
MQTLSPQVFDRFVLAGGGNRCWWQAGVLQAWSEAGVIHTRKFAGASAGAAIAAAHLSGSLARAEAACRELYSACNSIWVGKRKAWFAHTHIYPAWLKAFFNERDLNWQADAELLTSIARIPRWAQPVESVGLSLGVALYFVEKGGAGKSPHAVWPTRLGFRNELVQLTNRTTYLDAANALLSSATAVPFMPVRQLDGRLAIDGGFADHAPQPPLVVNGVQEKQLVLLTRHNSHRQSIFEFSGRTYFQPSRPIPVSTWDCTKRCDISAAIALGRADAMACMR